MTAKTLEIVIEARVDGDDISGHVSEAVGERRSFTGWLGLIAALDALVDVSSAADGQPSVRVCVAFPDADDANRFASSGSLGVAMLEAGAGNEPEIWFTHARPVRDER